MRPSCECKDDRQHLEFRGIEDRDEMKLENRFSPIAGCFSGRPGDSRPCPRSRETFALSLLLTGLVFLAACQTPRPRATPPGSGLPPGPDGTHEMRGNASWYGPGFEGKPTSSKEIFTGTELTAAHRTLPFGTVVRVAVTGSGEEAGREVDVRINDRGPFITGRIIDLSRTAARKIGLDRAGVLPVELTVVSWSQSGAPVSEKLDPDRLYVLQIGVFASYENARQLRIRVEPMIDTLVEVKERAGVYRVIAGPLQGLRAASAARKTLEAIGIEGILSPF